MMYYFTPEIIVQANKNLEALDPKVGGLMCILRCLREDIEENVSYLIDGERLRTQLSLVFDKEPKDSFEGAKPSYIIFAKNWASTFFVDFIKNKVDLLSCAVFFLRRQGFEKEYTKDEIIDIFIKRYNLAPYKDQWFYDGNKIKLGYNQCDVEENQTEFYVKMGYNTTFKSILFRNVIQKSAADLKAAEQIQTLYSGSGIHTCLLLSDEPLDQYYVMVNSKKGNNDTEIDRESNEEDFREWFSNQVKENGAPYSENTQTQYISALKAVASSFAGAIAPFESIFMVDDTLTFDRVSSAIKADPGFDDFNSSRGNGSLSAGLELYGKFLSERTLNVDVEYHTGYHSNYARNRILFGAPGTGKSFTIKAEATKLLANGGQSERVTFHPDYSYANFVGTYKPVPSIDSEGKDAITYSYVPGPFMRIYVKALKNSRELNPLPHLLIIEEINRANVAAVFGDVFQLLDRDDEEVSEYPIQASEDIKKYLASELGGDPEDYAEIRIPDNMFIWATMNSADQGVFPMDTAFKRRWDFTYLGIDDSEAGIVGKTVILGKGEYRRVVEWNALRKAINEELLTYKVNEDKLMGPYFISKKNLPEGNVIDPVEFTRIFKNKVIMYLFDDAAKQKRVSLFGGCDEKAKNQYSKICAEFDTKGVFIFCEDIRKKFIEIPEGTEE